jgi:hypothetical protein
MGAVNPDMDNGFRPSRGQKVRVVGRCHPRIYNKVVRVSDVDDEGTTIYYDTTDGEGAYTWGRYGGLEPVDESTPCDVLPGIRKKVEVGFTSEENRSSITSPTQDEACETTKRKNETGLYKSEQTE